MMYINNPFIKYYSFNFDIVLFPKDSKSVPDLEGAGRATSGPLHLIHLFKAYPTFLQF